MPARISVTLRPKVLHDRGPAPQTGPAVHALVLRALAERAPEVAAWLHDLEGSKPLAIAPLRQLPGTDRPAYAFAVGVLIDELADSFGEALASLRDVQIGHSSFFVDTVAGEGIPYAELAAQAPPELRWRLRFCTPTTVRTPPGRGARRALPLPSVDIVFGSLLRRWSLFSGGVPLPGVSTVLDEHLELCGCAVETRPFVVRHGTGASRSVIYTGFQGWAEYRVVEPQELADEALAAVSALVSYASFAGVGEQTTKGMGVAEEVGVGQGRSKVGRRRPPALRLHRPEAAEAPAGAPPAGNAGEPRPGAVARGRALPLAPEARREPGKEDDQRWR